LEGEGTTDNGILGDLIEQKQNKTTTGANLFIKLSFKQDVYFLTKDVFFCENV